MKKIIISIIVVVFFYYLITWILKDSEIDEFNESFDAQNGKTKETKTALISDFGYSFWIYINNWTAGAEKPILEHTLSGGGTDNRKIVMDNASNTLTVTIPLEGSSSSDAIASLENIPLQRWVHAVVSVTNQTLDMYLDGKLVKSKIINGIPKKNETELTIGGTESFEGRISRVYYKHSPINARDADKYYSEGPRPSGWLGGLFSGMFGRYDFKFSLFRNDKEIADWMW